MSDPDAVRVESAHGTAVVYLSGEIDVSHTERLETEIRSAVVGAESIVIDLEAVEFLDSSGLRLLKRLSLGARQTCPSTSRVRARRAHGSGVDLPSRVPKRHGNAMHKVE
jgi:ABC-type transporter Mla MlaB component